jgi:hypothetical protein
VGERWSGLANLCPFGTPAPALDLLAKLLACHPRDRPSARDALHHPFFWDEPKVAAWRFQAAARAAAEGHAETDKGAEAVAVASEAAAALAALELAGCEAASDENTGARPRQGLLARNGSISLASFAVLNGDDDGGGGGGAPLAAGPWASALAAPDAAAAGGKVLLYVPSAPTAAPEAVPPPAAAGQENATAVADFAWAPLPKGPFLGLARSQQLGLARTGIPGKARTVSLASKLSAPRQLVRPPTSKLRDPPAALRPYILPPAKKRAFAPSRL